MIFMAAEDNLRADFKMEAPKEQTFWETMREARLKEESEKKAKRDKFWKGLRDFGSALKDVGYIGKKTVTTKEVRVVVVEKVQKGADGIWSEMKSDFRKAGQEFGKQFNAACNLLSGEIDKGVNTLVDKGAEAGTKMVKVISRELIGPAIDTFVVPAVKLLEDADEMSARMDASVTEMLAKPLQRGGAALRDVVDNPSMVYLSRQGEISRGNTERKSWLEGMVERVGGWLDRGRRKAAELRIEADGRQQDAKKLREWYKNRPKTSAALGGVAQAMRSI